MLQRISVFFSVTFQPLFMPFVAVLLMLLLNVKLNDATPLVTRKFIVMISFMCTIILPALLFLLFYKMKWVSDLNLTVRKERIIPTAIVLCFFFYLYYAIRNAEGSPRELVSILLGCIIGIFVANIITTFWKISIHALGVFSVVGALFALSLATKEAIPIVTYVFLGIAVCVGISRLILNRHTPLQVLFGSILGFVCPVLASVYDWYL